MTKEECMDIHSKLDRVIELLASIEKEQADHHAKMYCENCGDYLGDPVGGLCWNCLGYDPDIFGR